MTDERGSSNLLHDGCKQFLNGDPEYAYSDNVRLFHADCMSILPQLEMNSVDLLLTDPPYNLGLFMKGRDTNLRAMRDNFFGVQPWDNLTYPEWRASMSDFFRESSKVVRKGGSMIVFMSIIKVETIIELAEEYGFYYKTTGIWHKRNPMPRNMNLHFINSTEAWLYFVRGARTGTFNNHGTALHDFIECAVTPAGERRFGKHPTQKPETLISHFVDTLSDPGDCVCDPFMGSGTTGVVALRGERRFIGIELDSSYFEIAANRIANAS